MIHAGTDAVAEVEDFVAEAVLAGEEIFGAGVADVGGFEGVWALAASAAAAKMRARTNRFIAGTLPCCIPNWLDSKLVGFQTRWIPKESVSSGRDQRGQRAPGTEGLLTLVGQHGGE